MVNLGNIPDKKDRVMFDAFRRMLTFLCGLVIVLVSFLQECPRPAAIAIGLLLMGVFSVPEVIGFVKGKIREEDT